MAALCDRNKIVVYAGFYLWMHVDGRDGRVSIAIRKKINS